MKTTTQKLIGFILALVALFAVISAFQRTPHAKPWGDSANIVCIGEHFATCAAHIMSLDAIAFDAEQFRHEHLRATVNTRMLPNARPARFALYVDITPAFRGDHRC